MAVSPVIAENQPAPFITQMIEEDYSGGTRSASLDCFSINDAGMLAFLIGNDHSEFAVLFHNIDPLDINLSELLLAALQCKSGENKHRSQKRGNDSVSFQE